MISKAFRNSIYFHKLRQKTEGENITCGYTCVTASSPETNMPRTKVNDVSNPNISFEPDQLITEYYHSINNPSLTPSFRSASYDAAVKQILLILPVLFRITTSLQSNFSNTLPVARNLLGSRVFSDKSHASVVEETDMRR